MGDNGSMIMLLLGICCCSSSSVSVLGGGGAAFAFLRSRQAAAGEGGGEAAPPTPSAPPRAPPPRGVRKVGRSIGKAFKRPPRAVRKVVRSIRKVFKRPPRAVRKVGRSIRKVFRRPRRAVRKVFRKIRRPRRAVRKVFRKIRRPRRAVRKVRKVFKKFRRRRWCFSPETLIKLESGETVLMKNLKLGDILINGSVVDAVMKIKNENDPYYKIKDILVTGKHHVEYENKYIRVMNLPGATRTEIVDDELCCLVTSDHKIPVGDFIFWDWEDNLTPSH